MHFEDKDLLRTVDQLLQLFPNESPEVLDVIRNRALDRMHSARQALVHALELRRTTNPREISDNYLYNLGRLASGKRISSD